MTHRPYRLAALVAAVALLGALACSDDEPEASDRTSDDPTEVEWQLTAEGEDKDVDRAGGAPPAVRPFIALLCRSADKADTFGITPERIQDTLVGPNRSIDGYLKEMSYGAMSIAGSRAAGWFALPKPSNAYADSLAGVEEITRDCAAAATAGGVDLGPFGNVMVFTNGDLNGALGTTTNRAPITVGGQPREVTTVVLSQRALNSPPLVLHELGHVFGGTHTDSPTDPLGGGAALGDAFDVPWAVRNASIAPGYDASTRDAAGWIPADRKARHTGGTQAYTLNRLTQPGTGGSLLVDVPIGTTTARYVVSARTRIGYDEQASLENVTFLGYAVPEPGTVIEKVDTDTDTTTMRSNGTGDAATVWKAGQTFTDAANGITIAVDRFDDGGAQVTVTAPGGSTSSTTTAPSSTAPATTGPTTTTTTTSPPAATVPAQTAPVQTAPAEPTTTAPAPTGTTPTDERDRAPQVRIPADIRVSTVGAGSAGEPQPCASIGATVWFKVTVPASGQVTISTVGSDYDTVLGFYADTGGGPANLAEIGCVDDADGRSQATSPMNGPVGGTLYVQVGGYRGATGNLVVSVI